MNKRFLFTLFLALIVLFSASAIYASDLNTTDSYASNLVDDTADVSTSMGDTAYTSMSSVSSDSNVDNDSSKISLSSEESLESENSKSLSTNTDSNLLASGSNPTELVSLSKNVYYKGVLTVTLKEVNGAVLSGKIVNFVINGEKFSGVTDANGVASVTLTLTPGTYSASASFTGDNTHAASEVSSKFNVLSTIDAKDITKYYKGSTKYTATLYTSQGSLLANTNVNITLNGKTYSRTTNAKGQVSLDVNLKPGTYKVTIVDPLTDYSKTTSFKILPTIAAKSLKKVYTDNKKFSAKFYKSNGKVLANKNVKFKINGKTYTSKTNKNGVATLSLTTLPKGLYDIVSYNTADGSTKTNKVKVYRKVSTKLTLNKYTFLKSNTKVIKATLIHGLGYAPGAGKEIQFTVNKKTYTRYTNSKGVAALKLPYLSPDVYGVWAKFAGNSFYKASSAGNKVEVIPSKNPTFTVKSTTNFGIGSGSPFKVELKSGNVPLQKRVVTFKVNGKTHERTTNNAGITSITLNLPVGQYGISYSFKKESKVNAKSGSSKITFKVRTPTSLAWGSGTSLYSGSNKLKVLLRDSNNKAISGKTVKLTLGSKNYSATTDSLGYASFVVNLNVGTHTVSYNYEAVKDNDNAPSSGSAKITVKKSLTSSYGFWVFGSDMKNVNLKTLASKGTTDIFLNYYAISAHGKSAVESWISSANTLGIRVHIWMQAFYDGSWVNPATAGSSFINKKINEAVSYAKLNGVAGVHLDYIRYPGNAYKTSGGTDAVSNFVKKVVSAVHDVDSSLIVSAAIMPETTDNKYYYGQDYAVFSKYLDVVMPMIYKGNYNSGTSWIESTTQWFVKNSKGAKVWAGLQSYVSDDDTTKLSVSALTTDCSSALAGGASGVMLFRWGLTNFIDFQTLKSSSSSSSYKITGTGLNQANTFSSSVLAGYKVSTTNCQVSNSNIQSKAKSLTSGLTSDAAKAKAIFNYVRDSVSYSFYYDTAYGAAGTLSRGYGNCVDQAHLVVALARASGLAARYVHGVCYFTSSGNTYGHVWAQILVDGVWVVADPTSSRNSLGDVQNWNTKSFTLNSFYKSLPF